MRAGQGKSPRRAGIIGWSRRRRRQPSPHSLQVSRLFPPLKLPAAAAAGWGADPPCPNLRSLSRRELLRRASLGLTGAAAASVLAGLRARRCSPPTLYGPFKMGIQSYSLRGFKLDEALAHTRRLGLETGSLSGAHVPLTTDATAVAGYLAKLKANDVKMEAWGAAAFGGDAAANRKIFEGAKALGITTISADPEPGALDQLDQLVQEFRMNIAIHNHGPKSRYESLERRHEGPGRPSPAHGGPVPTWVTSCARARTR